MFKCRHRRNWPPGRTRGHCSLGVWHPLSRPHNCLPGQLFPVLVEKQADFQATRWPSMARRTGHPHVLAVRVGERASRTGHHHRHACLRFVVPQRALGTLPGRRRPKSGVFIRPGKRRGMHFPSLTASASPTVRLCWHLPACPRTSFPSSRTRIPQVMASMNPHAKRWAWQQPRVPAASLRDGGYLAHPPSHFLLIRLAVEEGKKTRFEFQCTFSQFHDLFIWKSSKE